VKVCEFEERCGCDVSIDGELVARAMSLAPALIRDGKDGHATPLSDTGGLLT